jgi:hypothetical protein
MSHKDIFVKKHKATQTIASVSADSELFKNISDTEYLLKDSDTVNLAGSLLDIHDKLINKDYFPTYSDMKAKISSSSYSTDSNYVDSMIGKYEFTPIVTSSGDVVTAETVVEPTPVPPITQVSQVLPLTHVPGKLSSPAMPVLSEYHSAVSELNK